MDAVTIIWLASPLVAYFVVVIVGARWFRRDRARRLRTLHPVRHRLLLAIYLALVFTPSVISDFWLFMIPAPALAGFFFLLPGALANMFSEPSVLVFVLHASAIYYFLPLLIGFILAYCVLLARSRSRARPMAQSV